MAAKNGASTRIILHFYVFFIVPEVFKHENGPKMAIFTLNGPFLTKHDIQDCCKYFYMNGSKKLCQYL